MKGDNQHIHRDLIEGSKRGDAVAQEKLYKLYAGAMYNICRRMLGDEEEAKDLLQDSFVDAFGKLPSLREINTFSLWLKRIVTNNCINALRKRRLLTTDLKENYDVVDEKDDFDYTHHRAREVIHSLDILPDGCKTVLNLYLFEGYDHKEIAQILKISESASKAQYCKAKAKIRNHLGTQMQQYV